MDKEEKFIAEKFGRVNPFKVPEGYFEHLTEDVMDKLPESQTLSRPLVLVPKRRRWRAVAVAACFVVSLGAASFIFHQTSEEPQPQQSSNTISATSDNSMMEAMAEYTMLDNEDMYAYIADN